jgi:hypothetical protein
MNQDIFTSLLKQFTQFISNLSEEDINDLTGGKKRLCIELVEKKQSSYSKGSSTDLKDTEEQLAKIDSRDQGEELLKDFKKVDLQRIAKNLDIPIQKNEDVARLREKIIESTVGFKLRSQAIQSGGD